MDTKSCVTSLAISATSGQRDGPASSSAAVDRFTRSIAGGPEAKLSALRELRRAFADLKLDGQNALAIQTLIEDKISDVGSQMIVQSMDVDDPPAPSPQLYNPEPRAPDVIVADR